jgi:hypothetical protein
MQKKEMENIINQYFDNELSKSEEIILFTQLSQNDEARAYFKDMNLLRTTVESSFAEYPDRLDEKIFSQLKREEPTPTLRINRSRIFEMVSVGFAILLLAISFFFYNESMQYRNKLEVTSQQVNQQNKLIKVLFNTLPQAEVRGKVDNEIIVTSQM